MPSAAASPASLDRLVDREAVDAGHRLDRRAAVEAGLDEQRQDEVARPQRRLAHEVAQHRGPAQPAQARRGKGHAQRVSAAASRSRRSARRPSEAVGERERDEVQQLHPQIAGAVSAASRPSQRRAEGEAAPRRCGSAS